MNAEPRWRAIDGFPGCEVSDQGEVRCWVFRGEVRNVPRRVTPHLHNNNRWIVKIQNKTLTVAVLVLYAFRGAPETPGQLPDVLYLDNDVNNCHLENLMWQPDLNSSLPQELLP
jgi:hypothetical protein